MTLTQILIFSLYCLLVAWVLPPRLKPTALLAGSLVAVYWLQPSTPIRNLDFWLPTLSIGLAAFTWAVVRRQPDEQGIPPSTPSLRPRLSDAWVILAVVIAIGLTRYLGPLCCLTPTRPPDFLRVGLALAVGSLVVVIPARALPGRRLLVPLTLLLLVALFVVLKAEALSRVASAALRLANGQPASLASPLDLRWLGFSYLAFRLIHALRDFQAGKLPAYTLGEFVTYALFLPALAAGPIDRSQRFIGDLRKVEAAQTLSSQNETVPGAPGAGRRRFPLLARLSSANTTLSAPALASGLERILLGVFKKFVLADTLALVALNAQNATQVQSAGWTWVLLYAYALRIYFDFSGYTDVALGLARLVGITLPENFDRPYQKTNLTAFWNSWHITLALWFRAYFFNPLARGMRAAGRLPAWAMVLVAQLATMALIGLWHGITWNFLAWGAWHGFGLFIHNRWADWQRSRPAAGSRQGAVSSPWQAAALQFAGWFLTFHYVALGWVWFALPTPGLALAVFGKLFGV